MRSSSYQGAIQKTKRALEEFAVRGVKTNIPFLLNVFTHPDFVSGAVTTGFIADNPELFDFQRDGPGEASGSKVLNYLAEMVSGRRVSIFLVRKGSEWDERPKTVYRGRGSSVDVSSRSASQTRPPRCASFSSSPLCTPAFRPVATPLATK